MQSMDAQKLVHLVGFASPQNGLKFSLLHGIHFVAGGQEQATGEPQKEPDGSNITGLFHEFRGASGGFDSL
jgi:hypothetical protein